MDGDLNLRPKEDIEYVFPYLDEVERLVRVVDWLREGRFSPTKYPAIDALIGRITTVLATLPELGPGVWKFSSSEPDPEGDITKSSGINLGGDVEINGNTFVPADPTPALDTEELRRRVRRYLQTLDPKGGFHELTYDNQDRLLIRWMSRTQEA